MAEENEKITIEKFFDLIKTNLIDSYFVALKVDNTKNKLSLLNKKDTQININDIIEEYSTNHDIAEIIKQRLNDEYSQTINEQIKENINNIHIDNIDNIDINYSVTIMMEDDYQNLLRIKSTDIHNPYTNQKFPDSLIILKIEELIKLIYIKSPTELVDKISRVNDEFRPQSDKPQSIYYRGNKLNYDLSTSLYRESYYPEIEHIINNRTIQSMPNDFNGCENFFDKLTILKHFNCPSRLLDITKNPLIAAFFSLDEYSSDQTVEYGQIHFCFPKDFDKIKNSQNSDSVSLLSALCTTNKNLYCSSLISKFNEIIDYITIQKNHCNMSKSFYSISNVINIIKPLEELIEILKKMISFDLFSPIKNSITFYLNYINNIKQQINENIDKGTAIEIINAISLQSLQPYLYEYYKFPSEIQHQAELINISFKYFTPKENDINSYYIVHPSLNNSRIINQQGLFILVGSKLNENQCFLDSNQTYLNLFENNNKERIVFIIENLKDDDNKNGTFYNQLNKYYGINKGFIYPELEKKINQIKLDIVEEYKHRF